MACKRFIASQLTNGQLFEVDNKEEWFEIGVKLCTLLQKQDYSLVDEIISKFNIAGEVYDKQHFEVIDFINCSDNYATNLGSHTPFINLIVHILSDHTSSKTDKNTKIPALTYETNMPTEYQNFPKGIPTVNLGHTQEDQATGSVTVDTSNFYINRPDGILRLPLIFDYRILHYYQVGPYKTLIVTNCPSVGGVRYKYIMYVFREDEVEPYLVIGAETNVFFQKELQKLTPSGYEVVLPLYLGIFTTRGHSTLGMSAELNSIEEFASAAHNILKAYYKVLDNPIEISTDPHIDLINSSLDGIYESIQRGDYANSLPSLISIAKHLKGTAYRNPLSRTLLYLTWCYTELGHIAEAKACAIEGLDLERSRVKNNSIAVFLFELAKLAYLENKHSDALNQCHEAINLKLQTPVRITQGLASYVMPFNDDVGAELLLLALLLRESTSYQKSIELLEILRAKCEQSFNSNMLGVTLDELGIVFFEKGEYLKAISCFIEAISIKLKSDDYTGIQRSISILQTCCVKHPSANSYETKEHIRESRVLI